MRRARVNFGAIGSRDRGNLCIVSRNNDAVDFAHLPGDFDRPGEQRFPTQRPDVFSGHRFASASGGNHGDDSFSVQHERRRAELIIQVCPRAQPTEAVERLAIFGPFPGVDPGVLTDRENADACRQPF